jgi:uncharacterized protein YidB (DUF937 family)
MGLLDELGSSMKDAMGQVFGQAIGDIEANTLPALLSQVMSKTDLGSVGGLVAKLQEGGLGSQVSSWLGNGANLSVSTDQLRAALGNEQVKQIADAIGLPTEKVLSVLSQYVPGVIDQMSPNGTLQEPSDT